MKDELKLYLPIEDGIKEMDKNSEDTIARAGVNSIKGVSELIKHLFESGYPLAVAPYSPKHDIIRSIEQLGLMPYF